jgi:hypothetical protein
MKRSILMLMAIAVALIFFGCAKEEILAPESGMDDQEDTALKAAKVKGTFEGICTKVWANTQQNEWHDDTDDWRTTGTTIWDQPDPNIWEGTAVLILDAKDKNDFPAGKWEMTWEGTLTPNETGFVLVAEAMGTGVEGYVKGMKAKWIYAMNCVGAPAPSNLTFFYAIEGEYFTGPVKRNGPKHLR